MKRFSVFVLSCFCVAVIGLILITAGNNLPQDYADKGKIQPTLRNIDVRWDKTWLHREWDNRIDKRVSESLQTEDLVAVSIVLNSTVLEREYTNSEILSAERLDHIRQIQDLFLTLLPEEDFQPGFLYQTTYGLSGSISEAGIKRALAHQLIKSLGPDENLRLHLVEGLELIKADIVQNMGYSGAGTTVAVIDSGVDYTHPALGETPSPSLSTQLTLVRLMS